MRHRAAVHEQIALLHMIAFLYGNILALGEEVFDGFRALVVGMDDDAALGLVVLAVFDPSRGFGDDRMILRLARLEQLGHPRQTAGDIAGLGGFPGNPRQHVATVNRRAVLDAEDGVDGHEIARLGAVGQVQHLAFRIAQGDARTKVGAPRLLLPIDDHLVGDAGGFIDNLAIGHALDHIHIVGDAFAFGDDRQGIGIPFGNPVAPGYLSAVVVQNAGAVGHAITRPLAFVVVEQQDFAVAPHDHRAALAVDDHVAIADHDLGVERCFDIGLLGAALGGAADVESAHGELGSRLADGLRGDDPDRLADIDRRTARQITAVAFGADTLVALTGQHRADHDLVDTGGVDDVEDLLQHHFAGLDDLLAGARFDHVDTGVTAENTL